MGIPPGNENVGLVSPFYSQEVDFTPRASDGWLR
jgi:hypothetical protein